jgi:Lipase (class 3)
MGPMKVHDTRRIVVRANGSKNAWYFPLGLVLVGLLSSSCSSAGGDNVVLRTYQGRFEQTIPQLLAADRQFELLDDAAVLSAAAYDNAHTPLPVVDCKQVPAALAEPMNAEWDEQEDWSYPKFSVPSKEIDRSDLFYRVWSKRETNGSPIVVVAFRGTRPTSLLDWFANLRYITRFFPNRRDHYEELLDVAPGLIEAIEERFPNAEIVSAGHSLGGGLAQAFAYRSCGRIQTVFAFNPSVVTHKAEARQQCADEGKDIDALMEDATIYRVFERGEVLFYARWAFAQWRPLTPQVKEVKYNLRGSMTRPIGEHSMQPFACELVAKHATHEKPVAGTTNR